MNVKFPKFGRGKILSNIVTLYGVQGCTYLLPLLTFPYLARTLGPNAWGAVLFAQAIGAMIAIVVEYGFDVSATRETARFAGDRDKLRELVSGVIGAKVLLAVTAITVAVLARPYTLRVAPSLTLFCASVGWGVFQGINMTWYFQGLQRMRWAGVIEITAKAIATFSIFMVVKSAADGWKVMVAQALGCGVAHAITVTVAYREVGFCWPRLSQIREALRLGWSMFLSRASESLLTSVNGLILGFAATPSAVGLFGGVDKIRQIGSQALWPINRALFPHQSQLVRENPAEAAKMVRTSLLWMGSASALSGLIVILGAPFLVRFLLGNAFSPAIPALRLFGILIPLTTVGAILCFQWLLPLGFDKQFNRVVISAGILNLGLGILFASHMGVTGMALAVTISEAFGIAGFELILRRAGFSVFTKGAAIPHLPINPEHAQPGSFEWLNSSVSGKAA